MTTPTQRPSFRPARSFERAGMALSFNLQKIADHGEDADPLLTVGGDGRAVVGVFDGLGGSGSVRCDGTDGIRSGAYYGSRIARDTADTVLRLAAPFPDVTPEAIAGVLGQRFDETLRAYFDKWGNAGTSALRSSLFRRLPTTAAITIVRPLGDVANTTVLWAGDSRCYTLAPDIGLQQLTGDHLHTPEDALANLTGEAPISNCISADTPSFVDAHEVTVPLPSIFMAVTDGCFHYLNTPMHFEALLLGTMQDATSLRTWGQALRAKIGAVAGDDASIAIAALGWRRFRSLREAFRPRFRVLTKTYIEPLDAADDAGVRRRELWAKYAEVYEAHLRRESPCAT
ncbi:MAG: hypothetical protein QOC81_503 [Thermoanaerobaculia bacterium]|jgi:serine/threonine protein phosphatase PrpC|nr:hypothetical protein [Thermoanaerobaculia bacterium]